jgi:hypothetical protein
MIPNPFNKETEPSDEEKETKDINVRFSLDFIWRNPLTFVSIILLIASFIKDWWVIYGIFYTLIIILSPFIIALAVAIGLWILAIFMLGTGQIINRLVNFKFKRKRSRKRIDINGGF